jgi:hypothetical protein
MNDFLNHIESYYAKKQSIMNVMEEEVKIIRE